MGSVAESPSSSPIASISASAPISSSAPKSPPAVVSAEQSDHADPRFQEPKELANSAGLAERKEGTIFLHLISGKSITLKNNSCDKVEECVEYVFRGLVADKQFFLVDEYYYEGGTTLLFSRNTGEKYDIIDNPIVSLDGKYIVVASEREDGHAGAYLWEINDGILISRFKYAPSEYELFRFNRWVDSTKVEMTKLMWARDFCPDSLVVFPVTLDLNKDNKWLLVGVPVKDHFTCGN